MLTDCKVYFRQDTLYVSFPPSYPAYWLGVTVKAGGSSFITEVEGYPFEANTSISHRVTKQQLALQKFQYSTGDTLRGYVDLEFEEHNATSGVTQTFFFKGCTRKIVRDEGYEPFEDDEAIKSYSINTAICELGMPLEIQEFTMADVNRFSVELLNYFPASDSIPIRELTWNTSSDAQIGDGGIYRLTVWYYHKNSVWQPIHYQRWDINTQY